MNNIGNTSLSVHCFDGNIIYKCHIRKKQWEFKKLVFLIMYHLTAAKQKRKEKNSIILIQFDSHFNQFFMQLVLLL